MRSSFKIALAAFTVFAGFCLILILNPHLPAKLIFTYNENYKEYQINNVRFYVNPDIPFDVVEVKRGLEEATQHMEKLFGFKDAKKVNVYVGREGNRAYDFYLQNNRLGIYSVTLKLIAIDANYLEDMPSTIVHEYTHHLFNEYLHSLKIKEDEIPIWLDEGLAEAFEYELMNNVLIKASPYFSTMPFSSLEEATELNERTLYNQGFYATMYLKWRYGDDILQKLMEETSKTSFSDAWAKLIEEPYDTFHEQFFMHIGIVRNNENMQNEPEKLIEQYEAMQKEKGILNVYTPHISVPLMKAYVKIGQEEKAKQIFSIYEPFITEPKEYVDIAFLLSADQTFKKSVLDKGLAFVQKYGFDEEQYNRYVREYK